MNNDQKILKILESLSEDVGWLKQHSVTRADLVAEREQARRMVHEEFGINNKVFGTIFKVELTDATQKIVKGVNMGFEETGRQLKENRKRIENLEAHRELKPHKN